MWLLGCVWVWRPFWLLFAQPGFGCSFAIRFLSCFPGCVLRL